MVTTSTTPTPEEIEDATAEIRKHWNEREHRKRAALVEETWEVPTLRFLGGSNGPDA